MQMDKDSSNVTQLAGEYAPGALVIENLLYSFPLSRLPESRYLKKRVTFGGRAI